MSLSRLLRSCNSESSCSTRPEMVLSSWARRSLMYLSKEIYREMQWLGSGHFTVLHPYGCDWVYCCWYWVPVFVPRFGWLCCLTLAGHLEMRRSMPLLGSLLHWFDCQDPGDRLSQCETKWYVMIPRSTLTLISSVKEVTSFLIFAMFSSRTSFPRSLFESPNSCFSISCKLSSRLLIVTFCRSLSRVIFCFSRSIVRLDVERKSCFSDDHHWKNIQCARKSI